MAMVTMAIHQISSCTTLNGRDMNENEWLVISGCGQGGKREDSTKFGTLSLTGPLEVGMDSRLTHLWNTGPP